MDLFTTARRVESRIARTLDGAAHRLLGSTARDPLEVIHAVVEAVQQEVLPAGRGRRVFPYNSVVVTLVAATAAHRARYEAILDGSPTLGDRICDGLRTAGAEVAQLDVRVTYASGPAEGWAAPDFHVELARVAQPVEILAPAPVPRQAIELATLRGTTVEASCSLPFARVDLGRGREVRDTKHQLLRTNHVAFVDGDDEINKTVSRRHAHIQRGGSGEYRLYDDGSAHGTSVSRNGSTLAVRSGSRGLRLRDGDEIVLGEARLRVGLAHGRGDARERDQGSEAD